MMILAIIVCAVVGCVIWITSGSKSTQVLAASVSDRVTHGSDLADALKLAAGVYTDKPAQGIDLESLKKTVVVTVSNHAYLSYLLNFKCFMVHNV